MKETKNKFQFSKLIVLITCVIFVVCLYNGLTIDVNGYTDLTVIATTITVSGGMFGSAIIWYLKKSQSENNVKLKIELYRVASEERLKYNEQMMILKQKYTLTDEDLMAIEDDSPMDNFETSALSAIEEVINMSEGDADSPIELQTY
jgi:hypothetical protein